MLINTYFLGNQVGDRNLLNEDFYTSSSSVFYYINTNKNDEQSEVGGRIDKNHDYPFDFTVNTNEREKPLIENLSYSSVLEDEIIQSSTLISHAKEDVINSVFAVFIKALLQDNENFGTSYQTVPLSTMQS